MADSLAPMLGRTLLVTLAVALAPAATLAQDSRPREAADPRTAVAARGKNDTSLRADRLEALLLERYAHSASGNDLLELLVKSRVLEELAESAGLRIREADVDALWKRLDRDARAAGSADGLLSEIRRRGLSVAAFREYLRLSLIQERLTRRALELDGDAPVSGAQQEIWLRQELDRRGLERYPPPWENGLVARCGALSISTAEFGTFLRQRLEPESVRESAWHLMLARTLAERMPDLSRETLERAIDVELDRRRQRHATEYPGVSFEERLAATGRSLPLLRADPSVRIAVLTRLWVDRAHGDAGLRETYENERERFDGRYGRALRTHLLMLVAGRFKNELVPRTFEEAEDRLHELIARANTREEFESLVVQFSEEPNTRKGKGDLGWVTARDPRYPQTITTALFEWLDSGGRLPENGRPLGPLRLDGGAAMLWVSELRPSPPWEELSERVHEELRRRLVEELLPFESITLVQGPAR